MNVRAARVKSRHLPTSLLALRHALVHRMKGRNRDIMGAAPKRGFACVSGRQTVNT